VTGMSGTGKSSALAELSSLGFEVVDTDEPGWTEWSNSEGALTSIEMRWCEVGSRRRAGASAYPLRVGRQFDLNAWSRKQGQTVPRQCQGLVSVNRAQQVVRPSGTPVTPSCVLARIS
jgi:hypothetical protein